MFDFMCKLLLSGLKKPETTVTPQHAPFTGPDTTVLRIEIPQEPVRYHFGEAPRAKLK